MSADNRGRMAAGIDIGGTKVLAGLVTEAGRVADHVSLPTAELTAEGATETLAGLIRDLLLRNSLETADLSGIGVGIPGVIDPDTGSIASCPNAKALEGMALGAELTQSTGIRAEAENDVNLAALAEHWLYLPDVTNMVFIALGTGIGCGLILDGRLYRGTGAAGEFGHMVVKGDGPRCACGHRGCLETFISGRAIAERYHELTRSSEGAIGTSEVFALADSGDALACQVLDEALNYLAIAFGNVANLLAPELIVLGGGLGLAKADFILPRVAARLSELVRPVISPRFRLVKASSGPDAGLIGAARLVMC